MIISCWLATWSTRWAPVHVACAARHQAQLLATRHRCTNMAVHGAAVHSDPRSSSTQQRTARTHTASRTPPHTRPTLLPLAARRAPSPWRCCALCGAWGEARSWCAATTMIRRCVRDGGGGGGGGGQRACRLRHAAARTHPLTHRPTLAPCMSAPPLARLARGRGAAAQRVGHGHGRGRCCGPPRPALQPQRACALGAHGRPLPACACLRPRRAASSTDLPAVL